MGVPRAGVVVLIRISGRALNALHAGRSEAFGACSLLGSSCKVPLALLKPPRSGDASHGQIFISLLVSRQICLLGLELQGVISKEKCTVQDANARPHPTPSCCFQTIV